MSPELNSSVDPEYYAARAVEERRLAMACEDARVRAIHLELAERYAMLARSGDLDASLPEGGQQITA